MFTRYNIGRIPRDKQCLYNKEYAGVSSKWDHRPLLNSKPDHLYKMNMSPTVYIMPDVHLLQAASIFAQPPRLASSFIINVEVCLTTLMIQPTTCYFCLSLKGPGMSGKKVASVKMKAFFSKLLHPFCCQFRLQVFWPPSIKWASINIFLNK